MEEEGYRGWSVGGGEPAEVVAWRQAVEPVAEAGALERKEEERRQGQKQKE
jgi:hypothetical protein